MGDHSERECLYKVTVNHEGQYRIRPLQRQNATGWNDAGKSGSKEECLVHVKEVWTNMQPLSVRNGNVQKAAHS